MSQFILEPTQNLLIWQIISLHNTQNKTLINELKLSSILALSVKY